MGKIVRKRLFYLYLCPTWQDTREAVRARKNIKTVYNKGGRKTKSRMGLLSLVVGGIVDANKAIKQNKAKNDDTTQTVSIQNKYSIELPEFFKPTTKLNDEASLQYWNKTLDCGVTVIDETKSDFFKALEILREESPEFGKDKSLIDNYCSVAICNMFDIDNVIIESRDDLTINGHNAITLEVFQKRTFLKDAAHYRVGIIEGKDTMYQINIVVGGTSIKHIGDRLDEIIKSFKEL